MTQSVGEVGEFALIDRLTAGLALGPAVRVGPGDDAAVYLVNGSAVTSVDVLVEGVHFRRDWVPAERLGHRAVAVSLADLEAMGADPVAVLVGFSAPTDLPASWAQELMLGMRAECDVAGASLVGGDVTRSRDVTLAMTVVGELRGREPVLRSGAEIGDVVAIRGRLGWAAAGLQVLKRGFRSPRAAVEAYQCPQVAYGAGVQAALAGATAMVDVSDGLLADLGHLCAASQVRVDLDSDRFEIGEPLRAVAAATGGDPLSYVLTGGEDHALAATFHLGDVPPEWEVVGRVIDGDSAVLVDGEPWDGAPGWTHF